MEPVAVPTDLELECHCGSVHGVARGVSPSSVNRVVCYCIDCQTFAHHLGRPELLDEKGGSDIIQLAPAAVSYDRGEDRIAAVRLGPKGPYRWYATCCKTPLGNTVEPNVPFIGIVYELFKEARDPARRDAVFGPPRGAVHVKDAIGAPPRGSRKIGLGLLLRTARLILGWRLRGRAFPHPYFERAGTPKFPVVILTRAERAAARARCGAPGAPHAAAG